MIALFGGSFDPIHIGHIEQAKHITKECNLEKILFIPCGIPPHKEHFMFNNAQRAELLELAIAQYPQFEISTFEFNGKISYTIDTLRHFHKKYTVTQFIMGSDSFFDLPTWDNVLEFHTLCNIIVLNRGDSIDTTRMNLCGFTITDDPRTLKNANGNVYISNTPYISISSTQVRSRIISRQAYEDFIPFSILSKINDYTLNYPTHQP